MCTGAGVSSGSATRSKWTAIRSLNNSRPGPEDNDENRKKAREIVAAIEARLKAREALGIEPEGLLTVLRYLPAWTKRRMERWQKNAKNDDVRLRKCDGDDRRPRADRRS